MILKEINQASLAEINSIYADLNKHLQNMHVMPAGGLDGRLRSAAARGAKGRGRGGRTPTRQTKRRSTPKST